MMDGKKIFGAFAVGIALFFFWPGVVGTFRQVSALRASVAERQQLLTKRQAVLASVDAAYQEYAAKLSAQDGQKFAALIPVKKDQAEIISALQDMATNAGVTLGEVRISESTAAPNAQTRTLSLSLDMDGSYHGMRTFLADLESYVRLLNVQSIQASKDTGGNLKFAIKADAYFLK